MLVGTWFRHVELARLLRREPLRTVVLLIDEIKSHYTHFGNARLFLP